MDQRVSLITLGVKDLERSLRFYRDGLGFPTTRKSEDGVIFFQLHGTALALYPLNELAKDVSEQLSPTRAGFTGIALAHNVKQKEQVDAVLIEAEKAGGKIEKPAQDTFWGGYGGYFSDPDGYLWEVAYGAFKFNDDDSLKIT